MTIAYPYTYGPYQPGYPGGYMPPVPDQLTQLRQNTMQEHMVQQPQPIPPQSSGIIWVSGKQEADDYPISPGFAVALWDKTSPADKPVLYLRQTDSAGRPITITYDLIQRVDANDRPAAQPASQVDLSEYVRWDKLDEYLTERLKKPVGGRQKKEDVDNG